MPLASPEWSSSCSGLAQPSSHWGHRRGLGHAISHGPADRSNHASGRTAPRPGSGAREIRRHTREPADTGLSCRNQTAGQAKDRGPPRRHVSIGEAAANVVGMRAFARILPTRCADVQSVVFGMHMRVPRRGELDVAVVRVAGVAEIQPSDELVRLRDRSVGVEKPVADDEAEALANAIGPFGQLPPRARARHCPGLRTDSEHRRDTSSKISCRITPCRCRCAAARHGRGRGLGDVHDRRLLPHAGPSKFATASTAPRRRSAPPIRAVRSSVDRHPDALAKRLKVRVAPRPDQSWSARHPSRRPVSSRDPALAPGAGHLPLLKRRKLRFAPSVPWVAGRGSGSALSD